MTGAAAWEDDTGLVTLPSGPRVRGRRLGDALERARQPADRHFGHQAAQEIGFGQDFGVHKTPVRLNRNSFKN